MENNSKISENYVLISSINDIKKVEIPRPFQSIIISDGTKKENDDYLIVEKGNYNWKNHSINVIINPKNKTSDEAEQITTNFNQDNTNIQIVNSIVLLFYCFLLTSVNG